MINRRTALRQFLIITAGAAFLPACLHDKSKSSILLKHITLEEGQEDLLAELSETIIPRTDTPGAKDISAHLFALKMLDDCYGPKDRERFLKGLRELDDECRKISGSSFTASKAAERESFLTRLEAGKTGSDTLKYCYATIRRLTIQAYTSSQFYLTNIRVYELVPGRYHGCVPVKKELNKAS